MIQAQFSLAPTLLTLLLVLDEMGFALIQRLVLCLALLFSLSSTTPTLHPIDRSSSYSSTSNITTIRRESDDSPDKGQSILYSLWNLTPASQKATGSSAIFHKWDRSQEGAYGITYLYGCTGILISDPEFVIVGELSMSCRHALGG
jgi:hypothetical protein